MGKYLAITLLISWKFVPGRSNEKILIIFDVHGTHFSVGLVDWARSLNIILFEICKIACQVYSKVLSSNNLQSGFRKTGIYPFNSDVVLRDMLLPGEIFNHDDQTANDNKATVENKYISYRCVKLILLYVPVKIIFTNIYWWRKTRVPIEYHLTFSNMMKKGKLKNR
ncbi:hypothetical protein KUTeg_008166 [Tegillarca granosa]|uniref:DDE-1 domain-containing protein n=1 Tax=Tegillarca granosa TaxID=220873 RepID=A0ABQ9FD72_TEGGR|nr:hypothetical protein KUTeg_008166 [Tegillarca granosa]